MKMKHSRCLWSFVIGTSFVLRHSSFVLAQSTTEEELKSFKVEPPLHAELVTAEPLVESPCAMAFDEQGRLYVAENRGYPHTTEPPQGRVVLLESTKRDGHYDKSTVFADGLEFPNGVMPWQGGLIVTAAPDILFLKDTKGTGHYDQRRVLLTGFDTTKSTQLRVNCPTLGPDGWIHFAAGLTGGTITSPEHPEKPAVKMTGDIRWNPATGDFENVDGLSQYGLSFDDFDRLFICMNRLPVQHVVLQSDWLRRNPHLAFTQTVQDCNERTVKSGLRGGGDGVRVYPISHNITTADSHAGSFTAACAVKIWRGGALPELYNGCALSCEPTGNLIHADRLIPHGATFAAEGLLEKREILASSDDWCRPVFLTSGPDGALYFCDMYRKIIEHPDYLPEEIRKHSDFDAGKTLGRIWRITTRTPQETARAFQDIQLADSNWGNLTAIRLQAEQRLAQPAGHEHYVDTLRAMLGQSQETDSPAQEHEAAAQKVNVLNELRVEKAVDKTVLLTALGSRMAPVREVGLFCATQGVLESNEVKQGIMALAEDHDARVRFACALVLGMIRDARTAVPLAQIAARDADDRWARAAVFSGITGREIGFASELFSRINADQPGVFDLLGELGVIFGRAALAGKRDAFANESLPFKESTPAALRIAFLAGVAEGANSRLGDNISDALRTAIADSGKIAQEHTAPLESRLRAIVLLKHADWKSAGPALMAVATGKDSFDLRTAAIRAAVTFKDSEIAGELLSAKRWAATPPAERETIIAALLAQPAQVPHVLDAVESGALPANALSATQRTGLSKNKDQAIQERAVKLLGAPASGDRMKAYEAEKVVLTLTPSATHGREVFKTICSTCHRLDREGHQVGPDLLDIRSQPKESILLHIVVPDYEIAPGFAASMVELKDGRVLAGIVISDTPESITLREPLAVEENILRSNIVSLSASEHSLMPPGLEALMSKQDMADLLSFLKGEK